MERLRAAFESPFSLRSLTNEDNAGEGPDGNDGAGTDEREETEVGIDMLLVSW
jgi:hypothetical protein